MSQTLTARPVAADPTAIDAFEPPTLDVPPVRVIGELQQRAERFIEQLRAQGTPQLFASRSLVTLPYMRRYGLYEACPVPVPYIWFTNRMFVVRWHDEAGVLRTLLAGPTDHELGDATPFYADARRRVARFGGRLAERLMVRRHATVLEVLAQLGIAPEEVDWICFDHLHTQDVRRLVGTLGPVPELGYPNGPVPAMLPNARLLVQRVELEHLVAGIHPIQRRFYQPVDRYDNLEPERLHEVDGDVLVGPGVALMRTPGHTLGNHSLVVDVPGAGIAVSSENGIGVESWAARSSKVAGVARWARRWDYEVLMNFNTPEYASMQYNSMLQERSVAGTVPGRPDLPFIVPSSELTHHWLAPGIRPGYRHGELTFDARAAT